MYDITSTFPIMMISYDGTTNMNTELNVFFQTLVYEHLATEVISVVN